MENNPDITKENYHLEKRLRTLKRLNYSEGRINYKEISKNIWGINEMLCNAINYPLNLVNSVTIELLKNPENNKVVSSEQSKYNREGICNSILFLDNLFNTDEPTLSKRDIELLKNSGISLDNKLISTYLSGSKPLKIIKHIPYTFGVPDIGFQRMEHNYVNSCLPVMVCSTEENKLSKDRLDSKIIEKIHKNYISINLTSNLLRQEGFSIDRCSDMIGRVPIEYVESLRLSKVDNNKFTPLLEKNSSKIEFKQPISAEQYHNMFIEANDIHNPELFRLE